MRGGDWGVRGGREAEGEGKRGFQAIILLTGSKPTRFSHKKFIMIETIK